MMRRVAALQQERPVRIAVLPVEVTAVLHANWLRAAAGSFLAASALSSATSLAEGLPVTNVEASADQIAALIEQLDRPEFAERQAASQALEEVGLAALPPLESIAMSGS